MKNLIVVADWANDFVYRQEFYSAVNGFTLKEENVNINFIAVSQSSIHASFILSQAITTEERLGRAQNTIFFVGSESKISTEISSQFAILKLMSGAYVCGENSEYIFTFNKKKIEKAFTYSFESAKSNFKSRDIYSRIVGLLLESKEHELQLDEISTNSIPETNEHYIGHIDNFGNIITTYTLVELTSKYRYGDMIEVHVGNKKHNVEFVEDIWSKEEGAVVVGPSSYGSIDNPFVGIVVKTSIKDQQAGDFFSNPLPGSVVVISS